MKMNEDLKKEVPWDTMCEHANRKRCCPICFPTQCPVCGGIKLEGYTTTRVDGLKSWLEYHVHCVTCDCDCDPFGINDGLYSWNWLPGHRESK